VEYLGIATPGGDLGEFIAALTATYVLQVRNISFQKYNSKTMLIVQLLVLLMFEGKSALG
jgi:hypothetical protein